MVYLEIIELYGALPAARLQWVELDGEFPRLHEIGKLLMRIVPNLTQQTDVSLYPAQVNGYRAFKCERNNRCTHIVLEWPEEWYLEERNRGLGTPTLALSSI